MVERGDQANVLGEQHAVAEHVAGHVADADDGEVLCLRVHAQLAEVVLHRLPRAARGDAHRLVVIAVRAARCERVTEPEPVLARNAVGDVAERRRALVRGHDQIRVVRVVTARLRWRHHDPLAVGIGDVVVGEVQQARDERSVARQPGGEPRIAVVGGRALHHEPALGTGRHDDRVLDHLCLDQAEDLGAEVLAPVRPAQPPASHWAEAQVHALHPRGVDPDLEPRPGLRQIRDQSRVQLDRQRAASPSLGVGAIRVGAQRRRHQREQRAQDAVLVQARHGRQLRLDRIDVGHTVCVHRRLIGACRIEPRFEQLHQRDRDVGVVDERLLDVALAECGAGLSQELGIRTQDVGLPPGHRRAHDQLVEAVTFDLIAPEQAQRVHHVRLALVVELDAVRQSQAEVVDPGLAVRRDVRSRTDARPVLRCPSA